MRFLLPLLLCSSFLVTVHAQSVIGSGRAVPDGFSFEIYGGLGEMDDLEGGVSERRGDGSLLNGGLSADLDVLVQRKCPKLSFQ